MANIITSIVLDSDVVFHPKYVELKHKRMISQTINNLLLSYLGVSEQEVPSDLKDIDLALESLDAKKALLLSKKQEVEARFEEERKKYPESEGWKYDPKTGWYKEFRPGMKL